MGYEAYLMLGDTLWCEMRLIWCLETLCDGIWGLFDAWRHFVMGYEAYLMLGDTLWWDMRLIWLRIWYWKGPLGLLVECFVCRDAESLSMLKNLVRLMPCQISTHCGLVIQYGDIDLGQHWLRQRFVTWQHQALNQCFQRGPVTFTWALFYTRYLSHQPLKLSWMYLYRISFKTPRGLSIEWSILFSQVHTFMETPHIIW